MHVSKVARIGAIMEEALILSEEWWLQKEALRVKRYRRFCVC